MFVALTVHACLSTFSPRVSKVGYDWFVQGRVSMTWEIRCLEGWNFEDFFS